MKYLFSIFALSLFFSSTIYAQDSIQIRKNTLENQMIEVFDNSPSYMDYKNIKKTQLVVLRRNINDSIKVLENKIFTQQSDLQQRQELLDSLQKNLSNTQQNLTKAQEKEEGIQVLGINTMKSTYTTLMFSIILILFLAAAFLFYKYLNTNKTTKAAELKLVETEIELEESRQKALEREQILRRKLQDEINKTRKS